MSSFVDPKGLNVADDIDRAMIKARTNQRLSKNDEHNLKRLANEGSQRGSDFRAWMAGNRK